MTKSKAPNHLHRYKRINIARHPEKKEYLVYKCMKPVCSHYIPVKLAMGKLSECNRCGEPFVMTKIAMTLALPHCDECTKRAETGIKDNVAVIAEFLKEHGPLD